MKICHFEQNNKPLNFFQHKVIYLSLISHLVQKVINISKIAQDKNNQVNTCHIEIFIVYL